jgi:hypothetical protein
MRFLSFSFLFVCFLTSCDNDQTIKNSLIDDRLVGTWSFCKVDSCFEYVIQNPETYRTSLNDTGTIQFRNDGTGSIKSNLILYCNYESFTWQTKSDMLTINYKDSYSNPFSSEINFVTKDTININLQSCILRRGIRVWYEVTSSRNIVKR